MKFISLFFLIFSFQNTVFGQYLAPFAIIQDKDGFVNVREKATINSKIIDRIKNNKVFEDQSQFGESTNNWIYVSYGTKFDKKSLNFEENTGYIYKNRILYLNELPQLKKQKFTKTEAEFVANDLKVKITLGKIQLQSHKLDTDQYGYINKIDGLTTWGIDGVLPKSLIEIKSIEIITKGKVFSLPKKSLEGLFQPSIANTYVCIHKNTIFIVMSNGDGAGAYNVVWTIEKNEIIDRFINRDF